MAGNRMPWLAGFLAVLLLFPSQGWGLELEETIWDFGDSSPGDSICIVSVLLRNDSPQPFEGLVELSPNYGSIGLGGTVLVEQVFISPASSRWVQFYPYRLAHQADWVLKCGRGEKFDLPAVKNSATGIYSQSSSRPLVAWLTTENATTASRGAFPTFPAELFPPTVSATENLHIAILNEAPRWDQPRRQAFLQWLYRGGILHLYHGADGAFPTFGSELEVLNGESEKQQIGQGVIIRHKQGIGGEKIADIVPEPPQEDPNAQNSNFNYNYGYGSFFINDQVFRDLRELVAPRHQWPLIWLASIVYLLLIFPGGYLLGRAKRDFRLVMGLQIGSALLFTVLFSIIGARGYNETSRSLAIGIARPVASGKWDVSSWNNVFATSGKDYTIAYPKRAGLFATGVDAGQSLRGIISNGAESNYLVDIPPYSSCTFLSHTIVDQPSIDLQVVNWNPDDPRSFECQVNSGWPEGSDRAFAYIGKTFYTMNRNGDRLKSAFASSPNDMSPGFQNWRGGNFGPGENEDPTEWLNKQLLELEQKIASAIGPRRIRNGERLEDLAIVMIPASMPESGYPDTGMEGKPAGRIIYCLDLKLPGK